jgi:tetratricopeptide (TPR) repeat protein
LRSIHNKDEYYYCLSIEEAAKIYEMFGATQEAENLLNESVSMFVARYNNEYHSLMEVRYFRIAELKLVQGCYEQANNYYEKIVEINKRLNRPKSSLVAAMLKSKLCLYERATAELPKHIKEVKDQLKEHFNENHPYILRLDTAMLLRDKVPIHLKESTLQKILNKFL